MDIGRTEEIIEVEPIEEPFRREENTPTERPTKAPEKAPVKTPEKVPAGR